MKNFIFIKEFFKTIKDNFLRLKVIKASFLIEKIGLTKIIKIPLNIIVRFIFIFRFFSLKYTPYRFYAVQKLIL